MKELNYVFFVRCEVVEENKASVKTLKVPMKLWCRERDDFGARNICFEKIVDQFQKNRIFEESIYFRILGISIITCNEGKRHTYTASRQLTDTLQLRTLGLKKIVERTKSEPLEVQEELLQILYMIYNERLNGEVSEETMDTLLDFINDFL